LSFNVVEGEGHHVCVTELELTTFPARNRVARDAQDSPEIGLAEVQCLTAPT